MKKSDIPKDVLDVARSRASELHEIAIGHGILRGKEKGGAMNMPLSLNPKALPPSEYYHMQEQYRDLHSMFQELLSNFDDLLPFFEEFGANDELVVLILGIYKKSKGGLCDGKPSCVVFRNDFMYDSLFGKFLQVEVNTLSVGLPQTSQKLELAVQHFYQSLIGAPRSFYTNSSIEAVNDLFVKCHQLSGVEEGVILFVTLDTEPNVYDIIHTEKGALSKGLPVLRVKLSELIAGSFELKGSTLKVKGRDVAVVYFRSLYSIDHFTPETIDFWVKAEQSSALLIPDCKIYLLGLKLTQLLVYSKELCKKYNLTGIINSGFRPHLCETLHLKTDFDGQRSKMLDYIIKNPGVYVLKSYKEGGLGLMLEGDPMIEFVRNSSEEELSSFLLAYKIQAPVYETIGILDGEIIEMPKTTSEIGFFSTLILEKEDSRYRVSFERRGGHLLRSKVSSELKGGISIGTAVVDTLSKY